MGSPMYGVFSEVLRTDMMYATTDSGVRFVGSSMVNTFSQLGRRIKTRGRGRSSGIVVVLDMRFCVHCSFASGSDNGYDSHI